MLKFATNPMFATAMDRPIHRRRLTPSMLVGAAVVTMALTTTGWLVLNPAERTLRVEASRITISTVSAAPFHDFVPLRGRVVPLDSIVLDAVLGGRVDQVLVEAGQRVTAGQPLIRLSDPTLELDAIARETQVIEQMNGQRSQLLTFEQTQTGDIRAVADAEYNIVRLARQRARRLLLAAKGWVSQEALEQSIDELAYQKRLREIAVDAMQRDAAVIKQSNALIDETAARLDINLDVARHQLDALVVRAPADGVLTGLDAHVGEEKARGQHLGQIDRDGGFKVTAAVDEFYLARVKQGQHVAATIDGTPSTLVVAKLYPQVKDGKFEVDLAWKDTAAPGLRRGQAVQGKLELGGDAAAVVLPAGPFLEASGGAWVFVLDRDGKSATRRSVKLGRRTTEAVEVLDGLVPGDRVVTSDYTQLDRIERLALSP
jgi:HlyD family secretion protein